MRKSGTITTGLFGHGISHELTAENILSECSADYTVALEPLTTTTGLKVPGRASVASWPSGKQKVLGVVGPRYQPVQNQALVEFLGQLHEEGLNFVGAGTIGAGVWIQASNGKLTDVVKGDTVKLYAMIHNRHDAKAAVTVSLTPLRLACNNSFLLAMKRRTRSIRILHTGDMSSKLDGARQVLFGIEKEFDSFAEIAQALSRVQLNSDKFNKFTNHIYPAPRPDEEGRVSNLVDSRQSQRRLMLDYLFVHGQGQDIQGVRGTAWAAFNAVTEYETHYAKGSNHILVGNGASQEALSYLMEEL